MGNAIMNRQMGTKWYMFYTKVRPILAIIFSIPSIVDFVQYFDTYMSYWWLLLDFILGIITVVLCIVVMLRSEDEYFGFVSFVKKVLFFEIFQMSYEQGVQWYIQNEFDFGGAFIMFLIMFTIDYFIWYRLNVKYFEKRVLYPSFEPIGILKSEEVSTPVENTESHSQFCRKCGARIVENSKFCSKCGTAIIEE